MKTSQNKKELFILVFLCLFLKIACFADISPNPRVIKGIIPVKECNIRMEKEIVLINIYKHHSLVECSFYMKNEGDSINMPIGFPIMNFYHLIEDIYFPTDKKRFSIYVDGIKIPDYEIYIPEELKHLKNKPKTSAMIFAGSHESYKEEDKKPWYYWKTSFKKGESKIIKVVYMIPNGEIKNKDLSRSRFIKYLLNTGSGWEGKIGHAEIIVSLIDIEPDSIEKMVPQKARLNKKTKEIRWIFKDFEPTSEHDIYIQYKGELLRVEHPNELIRINREENLRGIKIRKKD